MVVFDSWALLAYLAGEPAAERIEAVWIDEGAAISSINLGEVLYIRMRATGEQSAVADVGRVRRLLTVLDPDWSAVVVASTIKARGVVSYADAFCVATAVQVEAPLWTGDPEIVEAAAGLCEIVDLRVPGDS